MIFSISYPIDICLERLRENYVEEYSHAHNGRHLSDVESEDNDTGGTLGFSSSVSVILIQLAMKGNMLSCYRRFSQRGLFRLHPDDFIKKDNLVSLPHRPLLICQAKTFLTSTSGRVLSVAFAIGNPLLFLVIQILFLMLTMMSHLTLWMRQLLLNTVNPQRS